MIVIGNEEIKTWYNLLKSVKRVSRMPISLFEFTQWMHTVNKINSLDAYAFEFNGMILSKWNVPTYLKDLIMPSAVTINGQMADLNLRKLPDVNDGTTVMVDLIRDGKAVQEAKEVKVLGVDDFNNITNSLAALLRVDGQTTPVDTLRTVVTLDSVKSRISFNDLIVPSVEEIMPIELDRQYFPDRRLVEQGARARIDFLRSKVLDIVSR